jgi:hypothetical protein
MVPSVLLLSANRMLNMLGDQEEILDCILDVHGLLGLQAVDSQ